MNQVVEVGANPVDNSGPEYIHPLNVPAELVRLRRLERAINMCVVEGHLDERRLQEAMSFLKKFSGAK